MQQSSLTLTDRLRSAAAARGEELLAEVPGLLRRVGRLLVVLSISVPVFLAGCLAVLAWHFLG
jgi:hypothetical protein